ncbi:hypothetical protein [Acidisphaera sp. L21]|uniref:hypothetical protein n=1 Tax=Acidisphaera sp. L21 TaxID=1641851 RepID=UPI00131E0B3A|nr:hypothetical protein [Acidisphaera sp. L21]
MVYVDLIFVSAERLKNFAAAKFFLQSCFRFPAYLPIYGQMMTDKTTRSAVRPLTSINRGTGTPYVRPTVVTEEIEMTLALPLAEAFRLASSGCLRPQTLVYLMRNFRPNRRSQAYDALLVAFYSRLERSGDKLVSALTETQREWVQGEVATKVDEWFRDDRMDVFEFSFKTGAERLFFTAISKVRRRTAGEVAQEDLVGLEGGLTGEEAADVLGLRHAGSPRPLAEVRAELSEIQDKLTEKERLAVIYVEQMGMIEEEAGKLIGCSARNVRYLNANARAKARGEERYARRGARGKVEQ